MSKASISIDYSPRNIYERLRNILSFVDNNFTILLSTNTNGYFKRCEQNEMNILRSMIEDALAQEKIESSIKEECRKPKDRISLICRHEGFFPSSKRSCAWSEISALLDVSGIVKMVLDNSKLIEYDSEDQYIEILLDSFSSRLMTPAVLSKIKECFETFLREPVFLFVRINEEDVNQSY
jgi:hypothetical protein